MFIIPLGENGQNPRIGSAWTESTSTYRFNVKIFVSPRFENSWRTVIVYDSPINFHLDPLIPNDTLNNELLKG